MFARVAVGLLVLHEAGGYMPPPPGPQTGRYIAKIAAGGNQGNRTRNHQVLTEIYRVGVGRKEAVEWKTVETERTEQLNRPWNRTDRFTPFLGKRCRCATQMERTVKKIFFGHVTYIIIFQLCPQKAGPSPSLSIIGGALL